MKGMIGERFHASGLRAPCSLMASGDTRVGFGPRSLTSQATQLQVRLYGATVSKLNYRLKFWAGDSETSFDLFF